MPNERRRMSDREVRRLTRTIEARERVQFPHLRVLFPRKMQHKDDYANWRGSTRRITVRIFRGEPIHLQRLALEHELTEIAHVLKGRSVTEAHRRAMRQEKQTLRQLPYRTRDGRPYSQSLRLMRTKQSGGWRPRPRSPWSWLTNLFGRWWP